MRKGCFGLVFAIALLALASGQGHAAQAILGKKILIKDPGTATGRKIVVKAKEGPGSTNTIVGDPTVSGATLRVIASGTTSSDQTFPLPDTGWSVLGTSGFKFINTTPGNPVTKVIIKKSGSGVFLIKALIKGSLGTISVVPPNTGSEAGIILTINGGDSYCASFGGGAMGTVSTDTATLYKVANPTVERCPGADLCPSTVATAKVISSAAELIDGPLSRGKNGDILLANDKIQAVVQDSGRVMFSIGPYGGNIIDADLQRCNVGERDNFEELTALINLENTGNYQNVDVLNDGTNGAPAVVRATGPDDLLDYINASSTVASFGFVFPASADDKDLPITVQTDYSLEAGQSYVKMETTLTNTGGTVLNIFMGDVTNGSGQVEMFQPQYGFGEPLVTNGCTTPYPACTAGTCDPCSLVAWSGEDDASGVSYGYVSPVNGTTTFNTSGVSVPLLGVQALLVLVGGAAPNFTLQPSSNPGDAITFTRYFAVGDGSAGAIVDIRNGIQGVTIGTLTGTVTSGGSPLADADVAVLGTASLSRTYNVVSHFRTAANGTYSGTLVPGTYDVRANKDGRLFGTPDPAAGVVIIAATTTIQDFDLPDEGGLEVTVTDENNDPIPAKVQVVGFDPSAPPINTQTIIVVNNTSGVFGAEVSDHDGLPFGIAAIAFADKNGTTGTIPVEPGSYQLAVSHGPRYSASLQSLGISAGSTTSVNVQLAKVIDTSDFISGDFHVHAINSPDCEVTNEERVTTQLAEGMDFFTPSDHDFRADFVPTIAAMGVGGLISVAPSAEITTYDYGHFNSWPVTIDGAQLNGGGVDWGRAGIAAGSDFPSAGSYNLSPAEIFTAALGDPRPNLVQINHIRSHFNKDGLGIDTADNNTGPPKTYVPGAKRRLGPDTVVTPSSTNYYDDGYDALEVWIGTDGRNGALSQFVGENLGDWINLLNQGMLHTGVADSDTHQKRHTQIEARTYVASTETDPGQLGTTANQDALAASVIAGKAIGTNAPFVTIQAEADDTLQQAGLGPSDNTMIETLTGDVEVTVTVSSPLWAEYDKVQLLVNSKTQGSGAHPNRRYAALPGGACLVANGCYEQTVTPTVVDVVPSITDAKRLDATAVFNLTGLAQDAWIVALVRGTDNVSKPLFPILPSSLKQSTNTTLGDLTDGNLNEDGVLALSFTNPLYVDVGADGWTAPGVQLVP